MGSLLKSSWAWLVAGLGVVGITIVVGRQPEVTTIAPLPVEGAETVAAPNVVSAPPIANPSADLTANITVQADPGATPVPQPVAAPTPPAASAPPPVSDTSPGGLGGAPGPSKSAGAAPAAQAAPRLNTASAPLSLTQVLPPGQAPQPGQITPSFDLVRIAPDGSAIIAGRAAPNANVQILSGGLPVGEATANRSGEFVAFLDNPGAPTLDVQIPDAPEAAQLVVSQDDIVILPAMPDTPEATPIVLRRTPDAVHVVQPSGPAIPANVSLDLVSYSASGSVVLAGRGQPDNTARIYANGTLAGEVPIALGGVWRLEIDDIAEGRYVLRVDEISADGTVQSRTESPFQREFPEAQTPDSFSQGAKIIVQPGNTLWLMATEAYGDGDAFTQIFSANKDAIRDPNLIYPGQIFAIPRLGE